MAENVESRLKGILGLRKSAENANKTLDIVEGLLESVGSIVKPFSKVQDSAIELAKAVGMSTKGIMNTATRMVEFNRAMQLSMTYNMSSPEMLQMQAKMVDSIGRNVAIAFNKSASFQVNAKGEVVNEAFDSELENLIAATKVFGEADVAAIVAGFDKLGKSMNSAAKMTGKLFKEAGEYGINLQKYTANFVNNLGMAQMYNFRNGVNGLKEMARKATEIRQDMGQISSFADKVGSVTGAVETAANLQVLGGSFAAMSNPLAMLNESLTNIEGLQDRFNQMTAGAARYNSITHEIEMDPVTRQIMKRAAESMGVSAENLINQAYAQARRIEVERQMTGIGGLTPELQKLLPNIAQIDTETGVAGATIGGEFYNIAEIAGHPELQKQLIEETRSESDDIKTIAKSVMGIEDLISGREKQIQNEKAYTNIREGIFKGVSSYDMVLKFINEEFTPAFINSAGEINRVVQSILTTWSTQGNTLIANLVEQYSKIGNPEEFRKGIEWAINKNLGELSDTQFGSVLKGIVGEIFGIFSTISTAGGGYIKERTGIDILPQETPQSYMFQQRPDVQPAASSVSHGDGSLLFAGTTSDTSGAITTPGNTDTRPSIIPAPVVFSLANGSMPTMNVSPNKTTTSTETRAATTNPGRGRGTDNSYDLNLSGTITMNINGDNGRIGTTDLLKMLQNNEHFKNEVAKILYEAVQKMEKSSGQIHNASI